MAEFIHSDPKNVQLNDTLLFAYKYFFNNFPMVCPKRGAFVGYKFGITIIKEFKIPCIIKLEIPANAKRSSAFGNKCRCDKAKVLDITTIVSDTKVDIALSDYDNSFTYVVNEEVSEPNFDENRWHECAPGIHFFMTKKEALEYYKNSFYNFNW